MSGNEHPDVTVVAGLLEADGTLSSDLTLETATDRLSDLLNPSSLWIRAGNGGPRLDHMLAPPRWVSPTFVVETDLAATLHTAWTSVLAAHPASESILRITVGSADDAERLAALATGPEARIVPTIATHPHRFTWKWPLRVAVADSPRAAEWATELRAGPFAGELFDVHVEPVGHDTAVDLDILIVDAAQPGSVADVVTPYQATCVMIVGRDETAATLLERAGQTRSAIAVGLVAPGVDWFPAFLEHLAHDYPVDVAITGVLPDPRVAGDPQLTGLTAVGRWATELGQRVDTSPDAIPDIDLGALVDATAFDHEREGAREVTAAARHLEGAGVDTVVEFRLAQAAAAPEPPPMAVEEPASEAAPPAPAPPTSAPPPTAAPASGPRRTKFGRQLLAEVTRSGEVCTPRPAAEDRPPDRGAHRRSGEAFSRPRVPRSRRSRWHRRRVDGRRVEHRRNGARSGPTRARHH